MTSVKSGMLLPIYLEARRVLLGLGLALLTTSDAFASPKMPPGAFLREPAGSVQALNRQLNADPLVGKRYARLYKMPVQDVKSAFTHLKLTHLTQDQVFQVHYVHTGEQIGYKLRRVRKGTPIYTFDDGTPVLVQVCGNPIRRQVSPSHRVGIAPPETEMPPAVAEFDANEDLQGMPANWEGGINGLRSGPPSEQLPPPLDFVEVPDIPAEAPAETTTLLHRQPPIEHIQHWGNGGLLFLPLAAIPLIALSGGSSSSPGLPPVIIPPVVTPPIVIPPTGTIVGAVTPEPGTITLLLAGALAGSMAVRSYRSRKKNQAAK